MPIPVDLFAHWRSIFSCLMKEEVYEDGSTDAVRRKLNHKTSDTSPSLGGVQISGRSANLIGQEKRKDRLTPALY
jgi:hypothetical protein